MTEASDRIEQEVEEAVAGRAADVREDVRRITLEALSDGRLDTEALRRVMQAVTDGARRGAAALGDAGGRKALADAMKGLDQALASAAEATDLAVREAVSRGSEFSRKELHRALDDLAGLETMFIDTLRNAARGASGLAAETFHDLAEHARNSGTQVGSRVNDSLGRLRDAIGDLARTQFEAGAETLRSGGALLAGMASGFLAGIAERLQPDRSEDSGTGTPPSRD